MQKILKYKFHILGILIPVIIVTIYFVLPFFNSDELAKIRRADTGTGYIAFTAEEMSDSVFKCRGIDDAYFSHSLIRKTETPNGIVDIVEYIDFLVDKGCYLSIQALNILVEKDIETGDNNDTTAGYKELLRLMAKGKFPKRCYYPLTYNIGKVSDKFLAEGFTRDSLLNIIKDAEKEWETALGKSLFEYNPDESINSINFTADNPDYPDEVSGTDLYPFPSNATKLFETNIFEKLFSVADVMKNPDILTRVKEQYIASRSAITDEKAVEVILTDTIWAEAKRKLIQNGTPNPTDAQIQEVATVIAQDNGIRVVSKATGEVLWPQTGGGTIKDTGLQRGFSLLLGSQDILEANYDYSSLSGKDFSIAYIRNALLYEFSHIMGFDGSINDSNAFLGKGFVPLPSTPAKLTGADISAIKNWCAEN